jgi:hypothetical protein
VKKVSNNANVTRQSFCHAQCATREPAMKPLFNPNSADLPQTIAGLFFLGH